MLTRHLGCAVVAAAILGCAHTAPPRSPSRVETFALKSAVFGNDRTIRVWLPPGYDDPAAVRQRFPVAYLNDGFAVFSAKTWNAPATMDALIAARAIPPMILVGIDNGATAVGGSPAQRTREYVPYRDLKSDPDTADAHGDRYPDFLINEVLPAVESRFRVRTDAEGRGLGGSSYGGVAALYTIVHHPGIFSRLLLESTPLFLSNDALQHEAAGARQWPGRVYVGAGTAETPDPILQERVISTPRQLESSIRRASPATAVKVLIEEGAAHNGKAWGARLGSALRFLWGQ